MQFKNIRKHFIDLAELKNKFILYNRIWSVVSIGDVPFVTRSVPVSRLRQVTLLVTDGHSSRQKERPKSARWENFRTWLMIICVQKQGNEIS